MKNPILFPLQSLVCKCASAGFGFVVRYLSAAHSLHSSSSVLCCTSTRIYVYGILIIYDDILLIYIILCGLEWNMCGCV